MLQGIYEGFVVLHCLVILLAFFHLLDEEFFLDEGVVEFCISVAEFVMLNKELESFGEARL